MEDFVDLETQFLAVAVTRYADSCPPGVLHPDCPYAVATGDRARTCSEQCRSVAVRLSRPAYVGTRRERSQAYDARQLLLSETGPVPDAHWHTASLVKRLEQAISHPPFRASDGETILRRHIDATNALAYLSQRGLDIDALVRQGLWPNMRVSMQLWLSRAYVSEQEGTSQVGPIREWLTVLESTMAELSRAPTVGQVMAALETGGFLGVLDRWMARVPLLDVVEWNWVEPPTVTEWAEPEHNSRMEWFVERLTRTYLESWSLEALKAEYRFQHGESMDMPMDQVRLRHIEEPDVSREIAKRAVAGQPREALQRVTMQATDLLSDGKRSEAAALFDATRIMNPDFGEAHNNFGFCMIIDDPAQALSALRRAAQLDDGLAAISWLNQAAALLLLKQHQKALEAAERSWAAKETFAPRVWQWEAPWLIYEELQPTLVQCEPEPYLVELALVIAQRAEDPEQEAVWRARRQ
jgi:hypothetical protein